MERIHKLTESAAYSVLIQVSFRASTFILNAVLLRFISRELLGIVNVRLMLLYTTLSFLGGEPFRRACLSRVDDSNFDQRRTVNLLWLCPLITCLLALALGFVWSNVLSRPLLSEAQYYTSAVVMFAAAVVIEKLAEPLFILGQTFMLVKLKASVEAGFYALRQFLFAILTIVYPQNSLWNFGCAMIISSSFYTISYFGYFTYILSVKRQKTHLAQDMYLNSIRDVFPHIEYGIDKETLRLVIAFWRHSFVKQILTEGERYVMTVLDVLNFADQGIYDVITNLGSIIARIIFAPLEESGYVYFSVSIERGTPVCHQDEERFLLATRVFKALLKLVSLLGFIIVVFGFSYSFLALSLYGGSLLTAGRGPLLLKWYSFYVLFLAINGITECFTFAVMPDKQVDKHHRWLVVFCFGFLIASVCLTNIYGSVGFILANCINMIFRIFYSCRYIHRFYSVDSATLKDFNKDLAKELNVSPLIAALPNSSVFISLIASLFITSVSNVIFCCDGMFNTLAHISVGFVCLGATLIRIYYTELELVDFALKYIFKCKPC